ncbi:MAG: hypothetical protein L6Q99_12830 [Planctomycetes bacterium]|nr:hypothetical protein [Planctomycetota bacterium]
MRTLVAIGLLGLAGCGRELETLDPALVAHGQFIDEGRSTLELCEVFERSSLGRTRGESGGRPCPIGTECSSRRPDPLRPSTSEAER